MDCFSNIFICKNPRILRHWSPPCWSNLNDRFFFSLTILLISISGAYSAGYSCPTYKKYTSCNTGYYLNGTSAGNSCTACAITVSNCTTSQSCSSPVTITNGTRTGTGTQTRTASLVSGGTNTSCSCSYGSWGTCNITSYSCSCNTGYSVSGSGSSCSCVCTTSCSSVKNSSSTQSCTYSKSITGGTQTWSGSQTCNGYYTSSGCYSAGASCSGCSSYGTCSGGSVSSVYCNANYYASGTSCALCNVPFTDSTSCTYSTSITGGALNYTSGSKSRTCYHTTSSAGSTSSSACTGTANCGSYGSCSGGTLSTVTCNSGYYKNASNTCSPCESGYYCPGGTFNVSSSIDGRNSCSNAPSNANYTGSATSNACPWSCKAGYYGSSAAGSTSCADCGSGNYCEGGTHRATCQSTVNNGSTTPNSVNVRSISSGNWSDAAHATGKADCVCDWFFSDDTRIQYMNERACYLGPGGSNYTLYSWCRTGYYASDPLNFNNWYNSCSVCTNKPANSTYTSYSTPSTIYAVENNCPWQCDANYYKNGSTCSSCSSVSFTETSSDTESVTGGTRTRSKTRTCYRTTSSAGSTSSSACTGSANCGDWSYGSWVYTCNSGYTATSSSCSCNTVCSSVSNTSSTQSCTPSNSVANAKTTSCPAGTQTCNGKYTSTGCSSAGASCTGCSSWGACSTSCVATSCNAGYYLDNGACKTAPSGYTCPDGNKGIGECYKSCTVTCSGNATSSCPANSTCTYDTTKTYTGTQYYGGSCSASGTCPVKDFSCNEKYYKNGSACSGCPSGYPNSAAGATAITSCYSNTKSRAWTGSQLEPATPENCASKTTTACSVAACTYVAYSNSAGTGDGTIKSGCSTNNASCTKKITGVSANENYYVSGTTCLACPTAYPSSDGGNISDAYCFVTKTNTGTINRSNAACATNSCTYNTCSCTPGTCTWRDYKSATDTTCTPTNCSCTNSVASWTGNSGYYYNGTSMVECTDGNYCAGFTVQTAPTNGTGLTACTTLGSGYTKSDGERNAASSCYQSCSVACITQACASNVYSCTNGSDTKTGTQHYGASCTATAVACPVTVNSCKTGNYKNGNACTGCPSTHPNSANANTGGQSTCFVSCSDIAISNGVDKPVAETVNYPGACAYTRTCNNGYNLTSANNCAQLCTVGIQHIKTGGGISIPLYASPQSAPALNVKNNTGICYGTLSSGNAAGTINIRLGDQVYHAVE